MTYTIRLEGDTDTVVLRPAQPSAADPIVCGKENLTSAAPRVVEQSRPGRSGVDDLTAFHDGATWQADLTVFDVGGLTRHQWVDRLRGMLRPSLRPWLVMQRDGWLTERRARVRGGNLTAPIDYLSGQRVETSIQVVLPDGKWQSPIQSSDSLRPTSSTGRAYPRVYPWAYTPASSGAVKIITVGSGEYGVAPTPVLMRLYGSFTDPIITNQTTGEVFELDGVSVTAGNYLEIDMDAKTVLLNGSAGSSYYSKINWATSSWWQLQPGGNELTVGATTLDASCELDLFWSTRYAI